MILSRTRMPKLLVVAEKAKENSIANIKRKPMNGSRQRLKAALNEFRLFQLKISNVKPSRDATKAIILRASHGSGRKTNNGDRASRTGNDCPSLKTEPPVCVFLVSLLTAAMPASVSADYTPTNFPAVATRKMTAATSTGTNSTLAAAFIQFPRIFSSE